MFKDPDLFELDRATRQAIYQAAQADLDHNHNLSWRDSILNHAEREFKSRLGGYISHQEHKSEQDSATVLDQADRIARLLDQASGPAKENKELKAACDEQEPYCLADCKNIAKLERQLEALQAQIGQGVPVATLTMFDMRSQTGTVDLVGDWKDLRVGDPLYTNPAPQQIGQGVPNSVLDVLDNFERKERSPFQAYLASGLVNELRIALLAPAQSAPPQKLQPHETNKEPVVERFVKRACPYCESVWYGQKDDYPHMQAKRRSDEHEIALMPLIEYYAIAVHNGDKNSSTVLKKTIEACLEELESQWRQKE